MLALDTLDCSHFITHCIRLVIYFNAFQHFEKNPVIQLETLNRENTSAWNSEEAVAFA